MTKELDGVVVKVPEGVNDQRWDLTTLIIANACPGQNTLVVGYDVIFYTCSVSKYWKKPARAWMPGSTLATKINNSTITNFESMYRISPVRFAARAVLCLANTSLQTLLVTCDVKLRIGTHHRWSHPLVKPTTSGRSMQWEKKNVSWWIFFEIGRW